jgi:NDP-sugar pyrophosphorylase family protein
MIALIQCPELTGVENAWGPGVDTCLLNVVDRPILQHILETLSDCGVRKLHVHIGQGNQQRMDLLGDGSRWGMTIRMWFGPAPSEEMNAAILDDLREARGFIVGSGDSLPQLAKLVEENARVAGSQEDGSVGDWIILPGYSGIRWINHQLPGEVAMISTRKRTLWMDTRSPKALLESQRLLLERKFSAVPLFGCEIKPGVWAARGAKIDSSAVVEGPAYIGPFAIIGRDCNILACSVIGEGAVVEQGTSVEASFVGKSTRVGKCLHVRDSLILGNVFYSTRYATCVTISDSILAGEI